MSNDKLQNFWYYGPTGTGKSFTARKIAPNAYLKTNTKWWDHYDYEEEVLIEEMAPNLIGAHHMKMWTDHYPFACEVKGHQTRIRPKHVYVTSNYSIRECYPDMSDY